eukprot:195100_1
MPSQTKNSLKSANGSVKNDYGTIPMQNGKHISLSLINRTQSYSQIKVPLHKLLHDPTLSHIIGKRASPWSIGFSIVKSIVGCGILSLPWATANIGLLPTLILLFISLIFSLICWTFLVTASERLKVFEFRDIGLKLYGQNFASITDIILTLVSCMYCILYLVYIGDFISNGLSEYGILINQQIISDINITSFYSFISTKFFILTLTLYCILFPLTLLPRLDYLKYSSIIGMIATTITVAYIAYNFFNNPIIHSSVSWINTHNDSPTFFWFWLESFGVFSAVFFGHFNTAPLYGELANRSIVSMTKITTITFILILVLNLFIIFTAYFSFGEYVNQNVIESLNNGNNKSILRILMCFNMIGSYPLLFWNIKISMKNLLFYRTDGTIGGIFASNTMQRFVYFIINGIVWSIAIFANEVGEILSLIQAALGTLILFIFPAMFYVTIKKKDRLLTKNMRSLCIVIVVFGVIAMGGGLISTIMNMVGYI